MTAAFGYTTFGTAHGFCGLAWTAAGVARFQLPARTNEAAESMLLRRAPGAKRAAPPLAVASVVEDVGRYFAGTPIDFSAVAVDLSGQDELFSRIYAATRRLGFGATSTYGALAKEIGEGPEAARDVGQAMAKNPVPLIIPCHRVLAAGGRIGGFSAPGGSDAKRRMLELEGVDLSPPPPAQQSLGF